MENSGYILPSESVHTNVLTPDQDKCSRELYHRTRDSHCPYLSR